MDFWLNIEGSDTPKPCIIQESTVNVCCLRHSANEAANLTRANKDIHFKKENKADSSWVRTQFPLSPLFFYFYFFLSCGPILLLHNVDKKRCSAVYPDNTFLLLISILESVVPEIGSAHKVSLCKEKKQNKTLPPPEKAAPWWTSGLAGRL